MTEVRNPVSYSNHPHQDVTSGATPTFSQTKGEKKLTTITIPDPSGLYDALTVKQIPIIRIDSAAHITAWYCETNSTSVQFNGDIAITATAKTTGTSSIAINTSSGSASGTGLSIAVSAGYYLKLMIDAGQTAEWVAITIEWDYD